MAKNYHIAVVGLGYVGLPVAVAFSKYTNVIGFDTSVKRVNALKQYEDCTNEMSAEELRQASIEFTSNPKDLDKANFFIIAVPTPINQAKQPDLTILKDASRIVAEHLSKGGIVVYESTVYPGATEEDCVPILEECSGLTWKTDFHVGYSPERINPGDKEHRFETITKIVSGDDDETCNKIAEVYGSVVTAGVYQASSIKVAEAAKVIENTQRDINIALINELSLIFNLMGIDTEEVLKAAGTKWNFLGFKPGLVGGHCIGVDPYYLTHKAQQYNYHPEIILSGRRINDKMGFHIAEQVILQLIKSNSKIKNKSIAVLGLTFKENCPDVRNSRVIDIINHLNNYGFKTLLHDPWVSEEEAREECGVQLTQWDNIGDVDAIIIAVAHDRFREITLDDYREKLAPEGLIADLKGVLNKKECLQNNVNVWSL